MLSQILSFVIKHMLLKFGKSVVFQDTDGLKGLIKEQNELIQYQQKKILELQGMILNAGPRRE